MSLMVSRIKKCAHTSSSQWQVLQDELFLKKAYVGNVRKIAFTYRTEKNLLVNVFSRVIFFNVSCGFNFANWLPMDFSRGFIFANLSFIKVLYILIFSWFVLQLVVCESWKSCPNFSMFQIALFRYKRLNFRLFYTL